MSLTHIIKTLLVENNLEKKSKKIFGSIFDDSLLRKVKEHIPSKFQIKSLDLLFNFHIEHEGYVNSNDDYSKYLSIKKAMIKQNDIKILLNYVSDFHIEIIEYLFNLINKDGMPTVNLKKYNKLNEIYDLSKGLRNIRDYKTATNQNFSNKDYEDILQQSNDWHESLKNNEKTNIHVKEGQTIIKQYDDGFFWLDLKTNECDDEADAMGHCGFTESETLISLRSPDAKAHVTIAYDYDGTISQIKGKNNTKPVEKYHSYIVDFLINEYNVDGETYTFEEYSPEFTIDDDFSVFDINDDLKEELSQKGLLKDLYKKTVNNQLLDSIYATDRRMFNKLIDDEKIFNAIYEGLDFEMPSGLLKKSHELIYENGFYHLKVYDIIKFFENHISYQDTHVLDNLIDNYESEGIKGINYALDQVLHTRAQFVEKENDYYLIGIDTEDAKQYILHYNDLDFIDYPFDELTKIVS